jgi:hypothetical protein
MYVYGGGWGRGMGRGRGGIRDWTVYDWGNPFFTHRNRKRDKVLVLLITL